MKPPSERVQSVRYTVRSPRRTLGPASYDRAYRSRRESSHTWSHAVWRS